MKEINKEIEKIEKDLAKKAEDLYNIQKKSMKVGLEDSYIG